MALSTTIYCSQIVWNSKTWTSATGGPLRVDIHHSGTPIMDRTGADIYPMFVAIVDRMLGFTMHIRDVKVGAPIPLGENASNAVFTLVGKPAGTTVTVTCVGAICHSVGPSQGRAEPGSVALNCVCESADGSTIPISAT
jgi:hypothetical protein